MVESLSHLQLSSPIASLTVHSLVSLTNCCRYSLGILWLASQGSSTSELYSSHSPPNYIPQSYHGLCSRPSPLTSPTLFHHLQDQAHFLFNVHRISVCRVFIHKRDIYTTVSSCHILKMHPTPLNDTFVDI